VAQTVSILDSLIAILRIAFLAAAVVLAVVCILDWMVRSRRINPFSRVARVVRKTVDPLLAPVERRVVRAGGLPSSAPLWALGAAVLAGVVVLSLLGFLRGQLAVSAVMAQAGVRGISVLLISWAFLILRVALLIRVISSWVRVSPYSRWIRWTFVLTEPMLRPLRRVIPTIGMIDITPLVAYFALGLLEGLVVGMIRG
jgi:YggT family protein